jgi:hypothetical protein
MWTTQVYHRLAAMSEQVNVSRAVVVEVKNNAHAGNKHDCRHSKLSDQVDHLACHVGTYISLRYRKDLLADAEAAEDDA